MHRIFREQTPCNKRILTVAVGAREREAPQLADGPSICSAVKRKRKIHYSQASDWLDKAVSVADKATPLLRYFYILGHLRQADILYRISCTHPIRYSLAFMDRVIICNSMAREQSSTPLSEYCCYVSTAWTHACQRQYGLLTVLIDWDLLGFVCPGSYTHTQTVEGQPPLQVFICR